VFINSKLANIERYYRSPLHHLASSHLKLILRRALVRSELAVVRLGDYSKVSSFSRCRSSRQGDSTDDVVVVFLLRVEVDSLHVGVGVTRCFSLNAVTDETETMVLDSAFRRASLDSHLLVTGDGHHALVSSLSVETTSQSYVTVSDSDTTIGLVDCAETSHGGVSVLSTAVRVHTHSTLASVLVLSSTL